jgi:hypothetical protein
MGLRGIVITGFVILLIIVLTAVGIYKVSHISNEDNSATLVQFASLTNPVSGLNESEAVLQFNESFVYYMLYSINAQNLRNPKIKFVIDNDVFSAVSNNGGLVVSKTDMPEEDIIIRTTKNEAVKMLRDKTYIATSFSDGKSSLEMVAGKVTLFSKGYLDLYKELTGKSITGSFLKI